MGRLKITNLNIGYERQDVVRELNLTLEDGEIFCLLGPSGGGKSTILKTIAGLLTPRKGSIEIDGNRVDQFPAEQRDAVLIFQQPLLFPFLNVFQNIGFGLKMAGIPRKHARKRIEKIMEITGILGLRNRRVHQLSGGQQQRVALARGLVLEPSILLLDEPFSALDASLRRKMRELISEVQRQTRTTMLFVTHDQAEAFVLGDRIGLLLNGKLLQTGSPEELFYHPATPEVAQFFGCRNFIQGRVSQHRFSSDIINCPAPGIPDGETTASIRPEDIEFSPVAHGGKVHGRITRLRFEGTTTQIILQAGSIHFSAVTTRTQLREGDETTFYIPADRLHFFKTS